MKVKIKTQTIPLIIAFLAIFILMVSSVSIVSKFLFQKNNSIKSSTGQPSTSLTSSKDESWTISKVYEINPDHYLAYSKTEDQEIWLYSVNTGSENIAFQKIDKNLFCREGCTTRSFSFSADGKKLIADLLVSNNRVGFGYINLDNIATDKKIHFIQEGYDPFFGFDGNTIFFYDTFHSSRILSYVELKNNKVVSIGEFIPIGWLSNKELLMDSGKVHKEPGTLYKYNITNGDINKIIIKDLLSKNKGVFPVVLSPQKDKILIKTYDGHAKLGIVNSDGSGYMKIGSENSPFGAWSPDGRLIAVQDVSVYQTVPSQINIINVKDGSIIKSVNIDVGYSSALCWVPNIQGDLIIVANKDNKIELYNLKSGVSKFIISNYENAGYFACY